LLFAAAAGGMLMMTMTTMTLVMANIYHSKHRTLTQKSNELTVSMIQKSDLLKLILPWISTLYYATCNH
jgi:hypothetical protein